MKKSEQIRKGMWLSFSSILFGAFLIPIFLVVMLNLVESNYQDCMTADCLRDAVTFTNIILYGFGFAAVLMVFGGLIGSFRYSGKKYRQQLAIEQMDSRAALDRTPPAGMAQPAIPEYASSLENELQKASEMLRNGLIDEEEYKLLKKKIIEKH